MWTCPECGEEHEDQFEACWRCGTTKDGISSSNLPLTEQAVIAQGEEDVGSLSKHLATAVDEAVGAGVLILGAMLVVAGLALFIGNRSGAFPTFPYAGCLAQFIGWAIISASMRSARQQRSKQITIRENADVEQVKQEIQHYEQALAVAREKGNRRQEGTHLFNLGAAHLACGEVARAVESWEQALTIFHEIGDRREEAKVLHRLGVGLSVLKQAKSAIKYHERSLTIYREMGNRAGEADQLLALGATCCAFGQLEHATKYYEQAAAVARDIGDRRREASALHGMGTSHLLRGQESRAIRSCEQGLAIFRRIGDRGKEALTLGTVGLAYEALGQLGRALEATQAAVEIYDEVGEADGADSVHEQLDRLQKAAARKGREPGK